MTNDDFKFTQILIAPWDSKERNRTYSVIALGDNGRVYRLDKGAGGWWPLPKRILSRAAIEAYEKKKYGARYEKREDDDA